MVEISEMLQRLKRMFPDLVDITVKTPTTDGEQVVKLYFLDGRNVITAHPPDMFALGELVPHIQFLLGATLPKSIDLELQTTEGMFSRLQHAVPDLVALIDHGPYFVFGTHRTVELQFADGRCRAVLLDLKALLDLARSETALLTPGQLADARLSRHELTEVRYKKAVFDRILELARA